MRTWEDERGIRQFGDVSLVWGSTLPKSAVDGAPDADPGPNPLERQNATTRTTTSIGWSYETDAGFTYVLRMLSTSRDNDVPSDAAECSGGDAVESPREVNNSDFGVSHRETGVDPYTHYRLCIRAENDDGASEWTFVGGSAETRPAAPVAPRYVASQSEVETEAYGGDLVTRMVWSVEHRDGTPLSGTPPRANDRPGHEYKVLRLPDRSIRGTQVQDTCENPAASAVIGAPGARNFGSGFEIEVVLAAGIVNDGLDPDEYYIYACVRANPTLLATGADSASPNDDDHGPWNISGPQRFVAGQPDNAPTAAALAQVLDQGGVNPLKDRLELTWQASANVGAVTDGFSVQYALGPDATVTVSDSDPTRHIAKSTTNLVIRGNTGDFIVGRVRAYQTVGGRRLFSTWNNAAAVQIPR